MSLKASDYPVGSSIYSFVDDNGTNIRLDPVKLRDWCLRERPEIFIVPLDYSFARTFIKDNSVNMKRLRQMTRDPSLLQEPIIFAKNDGRFTPDVLLVDGHHRYMMHCLLKTGFIHAWALEPYEWLPFEIIGLPRMSQSFLKSIPPKPTRR